MAFEAFKIAVKVKLLNEVSLGLASLSQQFKSAERDASALQSRITEIQRSMRMSMVGGAIAGVGFAGLGFIKELIKPAEEYNHQLALMNAAGMSQKEIAQSVATAWKTTSDVITSAASGNLKVIRELRTVFGDTGAATKALPQMQMLDAVLQSVTGGKRGGGDVAFAAAKALEMRGVSMNPKAFMEQADLIAKGVIATGGKVGPNDILQALKYSGQYGATFSNRFMYGIAPSLIQEFGGSTFGTMITSLMQALTGGRMTPQAARELSSLHLHGKPLLDMKQYKDFKSGMPGVTALGAIQGTAGGIDDPFLWIQNYLNQALDESGVKDPKKRAAILGMLFSNRTGAKGAYALSSQGERLEKDYDVIQSAHGIGGYYDLVKDDPEVAWKALGAQWENLKTSIAMNVVPIIVPALERLAEDLNKFGEWARANPDMTKDLVIGFGALSAAMAFGGTVMLLSNAFSVLSISMVTLTGTIGASSAASAAGAAGGLVGAVTVLGNSLTWLKGILIALGAGYAAGTYVYDKKVAGTTVGDWLGEQLTATMALLGSKDAREALIRETGHDPMEKMQPWIKKLYGAPNSLNPSADIPFYEYRDPSAQGADQQPQIHIDLHIDGEKVAEIVTDHQNRKANRAMHGGRTVYDESLSPPHPAYNGHRV